MFALPTHISRYEIKGLIGRGGMGDLYLARDTNPNTNRLVALKLLNATLDSGDLRERFARESRALAALNHPNIVNIYDSGEFEDSPYIVMEYVRGETLAEKIKRRAQMSTAQKLKLMEELCAGLAHAHEAGIVHRDIKPANLMVDQSGRLKILDFGIARVAEGSFTRAGLQMTQVNVRIGTPGYMSPEQIEGSEIDQRSDLFAVGAVCYELLSYREAFSGANTRQVENKVLQTQPAPLAQLVEGLDPELVATINRALEKDPGKRYQDAATFEAALERQRMRLGPSNTPAPLGRPTPVPSPGGRQRGGKAEAAYQRALAVYNDGAHDAARRFALETLAEDPDHEGARALHDRIDPNRRRTPLPPRSVKPPVTALPTVVKTRAASSDDDSSADLTIVVPRAKAPKSVKTDETVRPRAGLAVPSKKKTDYRALWTRHRMALQIAGIAVAAVAVLIGVLWWLSGAGRPQRLLLTIRKPTGGTISSKGIRCGTSASDCSTTAANGDPVELEVQADAGFVFAGYTGDCAPSGRTLMTVARTCGARFDAVPVAAPVVVHELTVTRPKGGTIVSADIVCGTLGNKCSATRPAGESVKLEAQADSGFVFQRFTGGCAPSGEMVMTGPRTCGATFGPSLVAAGQPPSPPKPPPPPRRPEPKPEANPTPVDIPPPPPTPVGGAGGTATPGTTTPGPIGPGTYPTPPPISPEDFAKNEIRKLLKLYCAAYQSLDLEAMRRVFPQLPPAISEQFRQFNSVECTVVGEPEFVDLEAEAGIAKIEVGIKMVYDRKVGGLRPPENLMTTAKLSRPQPRGSWRIDNMMFRVKR